MFGEVPVLPVVVPLGVVVFGASASVLWRRRRLSVPRLAVAAALAVYVAGVVANTVFPVFLAMPRSSGPEPLPVALVPFADYEVADAVTNVLVFVPLGLLIPLLLAGPRTWRVVVVASAVSLGIELTQLVTAVFIGGGHIADVNDWLWNSVGGAVGALLFALAVRVPALARLADRFRWTPVSDTASADRLTRAASPAGPPVDGAPTR